MGFLIRVEGFGVVPQWRLAAAIAGVIGLIYGAWLLRANFADVLLLLLSSLPIILWLFFKRQPMVIGLLRVDESGTPAWQAGRSPPLVMPDDDAPWTPLKLVRWHVGDAVIWVRISRADGWRGDLFIDRSRCDAEDWERLRRWLVWVERGSN